MRLVDVDGAAIREAVAQLGQHFQTKDVSEHPIVVRAHAAFQKDRDFHKMIGTYLSRERGPLGLSSGGNMPPRGEIWLKEGTATRPAAAGSPARQAAEPSTGAVTDAGSDRLGIGPQYAGDAPFTARMRLHQSWYRSQVLLAAFGAGPQEPDTTCFGNMLDARGAAEGLNFLTPQIFEVARRRMSEGPGVEPFRCLRNMLSSQPMCFNLFGPLVEDEDLATRLFRALFPDEVDRVDRVRIEYAPQPVSEYLGDGTSLDAFVEYRRPDGSRAFVGIETKLTDQFSPHPYDRPRYRELSERAGSPWLQTAGASLADPRWNQLWRNHLLVEAILGHRSSPYASGRLMLVRHPADDQCGIATEGYRSRLARPDTFVDLPLDVLVRSWEPALEHCRAAVAGKFQCPVRDPSGQ